MIQDAASGIAESAADDAQRRRGQVAPTGSQSGALP
jgi:hypothetical protein